MFIKMNGLILNSDHVTAIMPKINSISSGRFYLSFITDKSWVENHIFVLKSEEELDDVLDFILERKARGYRIIDLDGFLLKYRSDANGN